MDIENRLFNAGHGSIAMKIIQGQTLTPEEQRIVNGFKEPFTQKANLLQRLQQHFPNVRPNTTAHFNKNTEKINLVPRKNAVVLKNNAGALVSVILKKKPKPHVDIDFIYTPQGVRGQGRTKRMLEQIEKNMHGLFVGSVALIKNMEVGSHGSQHIFTALGYRPSTSSNMETFNLTGKSGILGGSAFVKYLTS